MAETSRELRTLRAEGAAPTGSVPAPATRADPPPRQRKLDVGRVFVSAPISYLNLKPQSKNLEASVAPPLIINTAWVRRKIAAGLESISVRLGHRRHRKEGPWTLLKTSSRMRVPVPGPWELDNRRSLEFLNCTYVEISEF